jgi:hypothetical protein
MKLSKPSPKIFVPIAVVLLFAAAGAIYLGLSKAATSSDNVVNVDLNNGTKLGSISGSNGLAFNANIQPTPTVTPPATGQFQSVNGRFVDPDGNDFIPVGTNAWGPSSFGAEATRMDILGKTDIFQNKWKWNTVRLTICRAAEPTCSSNGGITPTDLGRLDQIINEYTAKKIVIVLASFEMRACLDVPNDAALHQRIANVYGVLAERYKTNPYVWFNPANEPGNNYDTWFDFHKAVIEKIRATGSTSMIALDGVSCSSEALNRSCGAYDPNESAVYRYGDQLKTLANGNIALETHQYTVMADWSAGLNGSCSEEQNAARLTTLFDSVTSKNIPVYVGEAPVLCDNINYDTANAGIYRAHSMRVIFTVAKAKKMGVLAWSIHNDLPEDITCYHLVGGIIQNGTVDKQPWYNLTTEIRNGVVKPTNATYGGNLFWDLLHDPAYLPQ